MYLRKNKVRSGNEYRSYLSIAHNVWTVIDEVDGRRQSRPVTVASLGSEDSVDREVAQEVVSVLEAMYSSQRRERGRMEMVTRQTAAEIRRRHQREVRLLSSKVYGLRHNIPDHEARLAEIENMLRSVDKLEYGHGAGADPGIGPTRYGAAVVVGWQQPPTGSYY